MIGHGIAGGWPSPTVVLLTSDESPLPSGKITMSEASWIASLMSIGGLIGNAVFGFVTNAFGRKLPLILMTVPGIVSKISFYSSVLGKMRINSTNLLFADELVPDFICSKCVLFVCSKNNEWIYWWRCIHLHSTFLKRYFYHNS